VLLKCHPRAMRRPDGGEKKRVDEALQCYPNLIHVQCEDLLEVRRSGWTRPFSVTQMSSTCYSKTCVGGKKKRVDEALQCYPNFIHVLCEDLLEVRRSGWTRPFSVTQMSFTCYAKTCWR